MTFSKWLREDAGGTDAPTSRSAVDECEDEREREDKQQEALK